jgi:hypothetical protein
MKLVGSVVFVKNEPLNKTCELHLYMFIMVLHSPFDAPIFKKINI